MQLMIEELFNKNLKLVYYIINHKYSQNPEKEDLRQEGMIGLWKACKTFKEDLGFKFSTYAMACIKNQIKMYLRKIYKENIKSAKVLFADLEPFEYESIQSYENFNAINSQYDFDRLTRNLTKNERELLVKVNSGLKQKQIAEVYHTSQSNISRKIKKIKLKIFQEIEPVETNKKNTLKPKLSVEDVKFLKLYKESSKEQIKKELSISDRTFYRRLKKIKLITKYKSNNFADEIAEADYGL